MRPITFEQGAFLATMIGVTSAWIVWIVGHALLDYWAGQG